MRTKNVRKLVFILIAGLLGSIAAGESLLVSDFPTVEDASKAGWRANPGGTMRVFKTGKVRGLEVVGATHHGGLVWLPSKLHLEGAQKIRFNIKQNISPRVHFVFLIHFKGKRDDVVHVLPPGAGYRKRQAIEFDLSKVDFKTLGEILDIGMYANGFKNTQTKVLQVDSMEIIFKDKDVESVVSAGHLPNAPVMDGKIDEAEWKHAAGIVGFVNIQGMLAAKQTRVYAGHDDKTLYFAFESMFESSGPPRVGKGGKLTLADFSNNIDFIELWLHSKKAGFFRQYCFNMNGGLMSLCHMNKRSEASTQAQVACSMKMNPYQAGGIWYAEMAIPFAEIGLKSIEDADDLKVLFCRDFNGGGGGRTGEDWTSSNDAGGSFANHSKYHRLVLCTGDMPAVKIDQMGRLSEGQLTLGGTVTGAKVISEVKVLAGGMGELLNEKKTVASGRVELGKDTPVKSQGDARMSVSIMSADGQTTLLNKSWKFKIGSPLKMQCVSRALTGELTVMLNGSNVKGFKDASSREFEVSVLSQEGDRVFQRKLSANEGRVTSETLDTTSLKPDWYQVICVAEGDGKTLATTRNKKVWIGKAPWADHKIGLSDRVPEPFEPVKVNGNTVEVVGRKIRLSECGLPVSAEALGREILAKPANLVVRVNGKNQTVDFEALELLNSKDTEATWKIQGTAGPVSISGQLKMEFDGFAWWKLNVSAEKGVTVNSIKAVFELPHERSLYARGNILDGQASGYCAVLNEGDGSVYKIAHGTCGLGKWAWTNDFFYKMFVGDDDTGLSILSPSAQYHAGRQHIRIDRLAKTNKLTVTLTGTQKLAPGKKLEYDYAWAVLPMRLKPKDPKQWHVCIGSTGKADKPVEKLDKELYRQCPNVVGGRYLQYDSHYEVIPADPKQRRKRRAGWQYPDVLGQIRQINELGGKVTVDGVYWAAADMGAPVTQKYIEEWKMIGGGATWLNYYRDFDVPACPNSSFGQFMTYAADRIVKNGINGVYLDVSAEYPCMNEAHGCGWTDKNGIRHKTVNLRGIRELHKRVYTHYKLSNPKGYIYHHHIDCAAWAAFCEGGFQGEEFAAERNQPKGRYYGRVSPEYFRAMTMRQYGPPYTFFNLFAYYEQIPIAESMAMCLPHHVYPAIWNERKGNWPDIKPYWQIMDPWWTTSRFVGYWMKKPAASTDVEKVFPSVFIKPDKVMLVVGNWNYNQVKSIKIRLNQQVVKLDLGNASATDAMSGEKVAMEADGSIKLTIPSRDVRLIEISSK